MEQVPAELMKEFVNSQNFASTAEVMNTMKQMSGDVLQKVMEGELDTELGYEKSERIADDDEKVVLKNYRNGYSQKTIKSQLGEVQVKIPRDRKRRIRAANYRTIRP
jgi:transposase-like protein